MVPLLCASFVPNNRTSLNNKGSKMAALRQIAFDGKGDSRNLQNALAVKPDTASATLTGASR
ncbi:hypothetical protein CN230_31920 [Sinorhizobium meliloti]|nr:hypothetical protein CN230_31920 [Sinorhizobium meliloti]